MRNSPVPRRGRGGTGNCAHPQATDLCPKTSTDHRSVQIIDPLAFDHDRASDRVVAHAERGHLYRDAEADQARRNGAASLVDVAHDGRHAASLVGASHSEPTRIATSRASRCRTATEALYPALRYSPKRSRECARVAKGDGL